MIDIRTGRDIETPQYLQLLLREGSVIVAGTLDLEKGHDKAISQVVAALNECLKELDRKKGPDNG